MLRRDVLTFLALVSLPGARAGTDDAPAGGRRTIAITASQFQFDPSRIEIDQDEPVILELRSTDTSHGFAIKELKIDVLIPEGGEIVRVNVAAKKAGTFVFACTEYCGRGHSRMKGELVVRPRPEAQR